MSARRNEKRIHEVSVAVERLIAGEKFDSDRIVACCGYRRRDDQVAVKEGEVDWMTAHANSQHMVGRLFEIENDSAGSAQAEVHDFRAANGLGLRLRDAEREIVAQRCDGALTIVGQDLRNAGAR